MALARGTTTAIADSHEIANVCGLDGLAFMIEDARRVPLDIKFMMPSCVPALPDEQAGASITAEDMRAFMGERRMRRPMRASMPPLRPFRAWWTAMRRS